MAELFDAVTEWDNLWQAFSVAARGKRRKGSAAAFEQQVADRLIALQEDLRRKTYRPGAYRHFFIHEPKRRKISAAPFRDRVVHHALCQVIEPLFEASFIADSYANRRDKGTHRAVERLQHYARRYRYVLRADVVQHFPSLDHDLLRGKLAGVVDDSDLLFLAGVILDSGAGVLADEYSPVYFPGDDLLAACRPRGLPIGNLTSQFWSNVYLNDFDWFVQRQLSCRAYLRYVDDFALFGDDRKTLWQWKEVLIARLAQERLDDPRQRSAGTANALRHPLARLRRVPDASSAQAAQRGQLHAPTDQQSRRVSRGVDLLRRTRRQRARLDQSRPLRRHLGLARAHLRNASDPGAPR